MMPVSVAASAECKNFTRLLTEKQTCFIAIIYLTEVTQSSVSCYSRSFFQTSTQCGSMLLLSPPRVPQAILCFILNLPMQSLEPVKLSIPTWAAICKPVSLMIVPPIEIFLYVKLDVCVTVLLFLYIWNTQKQQIQISPAARVYVISTNWRKAHNGWNFFYLLHGSTYVCFIWTLSDLTFSQWIYIQNIPRAGWSVSHLAWVFTCRFQRPEYGHFAW